MRAALISDERIANRDAEDGFLAYLSCLLPGWWQHKEACLDDHVGLVSVL
jgi:hypothetical protein